ncbi:MAG: transcription elongation factor GreA [Actinobacteria bacterium]|uniref:Transcription elongation factor GreA n=1 Tax=freshwater metagenome TaxID=449393 RepID=A0A6J7AW90_9ZZZZ|nr:transcription elongation factor GreA [Actinomycetota bacterium]MSW21795.1 transcription elongation factor GreA [Actinomycetota bacterium]MSX03605.1 transcription elongation factor GreA [Actinomycetota bacterium]MSX60920.1 transcription elongation factor GreA [Actinomycetota bacterium]MSX83945.1 transcription elongation factor GreA [Actinomycetota bacterium]
MAIEPTQTWLTQEAADRLSAEMAELEGPRRADIIKKIEAARAEGDLKENGGYHAAKDEQGKTEARIRQLKHMLENAHIGNPPVGESGVVGLGMLVTVDIAGDEMKFLLGSREIASGDVDIYSEKSPLGAAVLGSKIGETVTYTAPNGREINVAVLEAQNFF